MSVAIVFKALYWLWVVTEVLVLLITRTRRGGGNVQDRGSLIVLWVVIFSSITLGMWASEVHRGAAMPRSPWLWALTLALMAAGLGVRWSAIFTLGSAFSANVAIHASQTLNRTGLFHFVRHPSYAGMLLIFLAMGLSTRNWLGLTLIVVPPLAALLYRIHVEEAALTGAFGEAYADYSRTTKRLFPGLY